jgi:hypothetical protein
MEEPDRQEGKLATSTKKTFIHQIADSQQEQSSSIHSSENNEPETQSTAIFPLTAVHPIDSAAPSSGNIEYEHRENAIPPVAEQSIDPIKAIAPVVTTQPISGVA